MRLLVRLIVTLLGLLAACVGLLLVLEVLWGWLRPGAGALVLPWRSLGAALQSMTWDNVWVRVLATGVALLGMALLLVTLRAGRREIRLHDPAPQVTVTTDPRSLARLIGHQVREQNGVSSASVTATRKRVQVKAVSEFSSVGDLRGRVDGVVHEAIDQLPLRERPKVSVTASASKQPR